MSRRANGVLSAGGTWRLHYENRPMSRLNGARRQIAADGDSQAKVGKRLATDISSSPANFRDDRIATDRTACSESCMFGVGGRISRASDDK